MYYRELIIHVSAQDVDTVTNIASMLDFGGLYIEDYTDLMESEIVRRVGLVDEQLLKKDKTRAAVHIYVNADADIGACYHYLEERLQQARIVYHFEEKQVDEEDYANSWKQYYKPFEVGERLVVVPEWEKYEASADKVILKINPGMAFGSGTHETTYMCMQALQDVVCGGEKILDVGCGSGILSVTALLFGAEAATAVDIDQNAVRVSRENAEMNGVSERLTGYCGNLLDPDSELRSKVCGQYRVVVANIVADVVIRLSDIADQFLMPDGIFIVSGIIIEKRDEVLSALEKNGFTVKDIREKNGWACIISQK